MTGWLGAEVSSIGKKATANRFLFAAASVGSPNQKITEYDGGKSLELETPLLKSLSWEASNTITFEEALEVT